MDTNRYRVRKTQHDEMPRRNVYTCLTHEHMDPSAGFELLVYFMHLNLVQVYVSKRCLYSLFLSFR